MKSFDNLFLAQLQSDAKTSPRQRVHYNLHHNFSEPVNRLFIAFEPSTYVRPHWHPDANKWELLVVIQGSLTLLTYSESGAVESRVTVGPGQESFAVEIPPGSWHSILCNEPGTVALEIKEGAFLPNRAAEYARWAPEEGSVDAEVFLHWAARAQPGDQYQRQYEVA